MFGPTERGKGETGEQLAKVQKAVGIFVDIFEDIARNDSSVTKVENEIYKEIRTGKFGPEADVELRWGKFEPTPEDKQILWLYDFRNQENRTGNYLMSSDTTREYDSLPREVVVPDYRYIGSHITHKKVYYYRERQGWYRAENLPLDVFINQPVILLPKIEECLRFPGKEQKYIFKPSKSLWG